MEKIATRFSRFGRDAAKFVWRTTCARAVTIWRAAYMRAMRRFVRTALRVIVFSAMTATVGVALTIVFVAATYLFLFASILYVVSSYPGGSAVVVALAYLPRAAARCPFQHAMDSYCVGEVTACPRGVEAAAGTGNFGWAAAGFLVASFMMPWKSVGKITSSFLDTFRCAAAYFWSLVPFFVNNRRVLVAGLLMVYLPFTAAVCPHCFGQIETCPGGDGRRCPFIVGTSANATAIVSAAATGVFTLTYLLPRDYLKVLTRSVLDALMTVVRRPIPGNAPDIRGASVEELMQAFRDHTVPRPDIIAELSSLIPGASPEEQTTIRLCLDTMRTFKDFDGNPRTTSEGQGILQLLWAISGRIVDRSEGSVAVEVPRGEASSGPSKLSEKQTRPKTAMLYAERISVFSSGGGDGR
jgi:hypothetical protein